MQLNSVLKIKNEGVEAQNPASGCAINITGDNTAGFITINTNATPFDLPISGTGKVCDVVFEHPYDSDNTRVIVTPYNRAADFIAIKAEGENGSGFEFNAYAQLPADSVLIYSYQVFEIVY